MEKSKTHVLVINGRRYVDAERAAVMLGLSVQTVRTYNSKGVLKPRYFGRAIFFAEKDVLEYARNRNPVGRPKGS